MAGSPRRRMNTRERGLSPRPRRSFGRRSRRHAVSGPAEGMTASGGSCRVNRLAGRGPAGTARRALHQPLAAADERHGQPGEEEGRTPSAHGRVGRQGVFAIERRQQHARFADVAQALLRIALQATLEQPSHGRGVPAAARSNRVRARAPPRACRRRPRPRRRGGRSASREDDAERPDVGALVDGRPAPVRAPCTRRCRGSCPAAVAREPGERRRRIVGVPVTAADAPLRSSAFASPKSSTFTVPSSSDLHVRRLEIAMHDALLVRGLERVGDLARDGQRVAERQRDRARSLRQIVALNQLHDQRTARCPVLTPRARRRARCSGDSARRGLAPRARSARAAPRRQRTLGQNLERDVASELRVAGAVDLAHAAGAEGHDSYGPRRHAGAQRHGLGGLHFLVARGPTPAPTARLASLARRAAGAHAAGADGRLDHVRAEAGAGGSAAWARGQLFSCAWGPTPTRYGSTRFARSPGRRRSCRRRRWADWISYGPKRCRDSAAWARGQLSQVRVGPHPRALRLDSRRSLAVAAGAHAARRRWATGSRTSRSGAGTQRHGLGVTFLRVRVGPATAPPGSTRFARSP